MPAAKKITKNGTRSVKVEKEVAKRRELDRAIHMLRRTKLLCRRSL